MFKSRSYVYGIGTGIIVGALLLQIMSFRAVAPGQTGIALDEMDAQKLKDEASKYYQVIDKNIKVYTQTELDDAVQKKLKEETDKLAAAKPQDKPQVSTPVVTQKIVIYVQPNLDATAVTELLIKAGLITDRKAFAAELQKQGGNSKLQVGPHVFEGSMDMQALVANLLTTIQ